MPTTRCDHLTAHEERAIAVAALVDPRTVRRAIRGLRVQPMAYDRIRAVLEERGLAHLLAGARPDEQGGGTGARR